MTLQADLRKFVAHGFIHLTVAGALDALSIQVWRGILIGRAATTASIWASMSEGSRSMTGVVPASASGGLAGWPLAAFVYQRIHVYGLAVRGRLGFGFAGDGHG